MAKKKKLVIDKKFLGGTTRRKGITVKIEEKNIKLLSQIGADVFEKVTKEEAKENNDSDSTK